MSKFWAILLLALSLAAVSLGRAGAQTRSFELSFTVDDLPSGVGEYTQRSRVQAVRDMIATFKKHGITNVYGFVNSDAIRYNKYGRRILKMWLDAGFKLGNHTATHEGAIVLTSDEFIEDIRKTDEFLAELGVPLNERRVLRYPYLAEGDTLLKRQEIRDYLERNGYRIAPVTMETFDWMVQQKFQRARTKQGRERAVKYGLALVKKFLDEAREFSQHFLGRQVRHVLLMHLADVHSDMLDQMLSIYSQNGAEFISLDRAMGDPAYAFDHGQASPGMGTYFIELQKALGEVERGSDAQSKFTPEEIHAEVNRARDFTPSCEDLFANVM